MAKLKGLGKGLDALFSASNITAAAIIGSKDGKTQKSGDNNGNLHNIKLDTIMPSPYQPRKVFSEVELQELANSIKQNGVIQPIVVRQLTLPKNGMHYELIAGERRVRASKIAELTHISAIVREFSDEEAIAIALIENIQRRDLSIIEEARCYKRLIDEFEMTHEELSKITSKSRSHITNMLRLLNLQSDVQDMLLNGQLSMGHARALLPLSQKLQKALAAEIVVSGFTTNYVETRVAKLLADNAKDSPIDLAANNLKHFSQQEDPDILRLETSIAEKLGMLVNIKHGRRGQGRVTISYSSLDELDNLLRLL